MPSKDIPENRTPKKQILVHKPAVESHEDDEEDIESRYSQRRTENTSKIKYLPPSVLKDLEHKNNARRLVNLAPITTRIRRCLACGALFQSFGNRTCGCASRVAGVIAGREII